MPKTAAMVQMKVVKGGGAGGIANMSCDEVKAAFGIVSGRYKDLDVDPGQNREHCGAPASAFYESGRGHAGDPPMPGCSRYNPDNAWCWNVQDGQTHFTEHRFLTDRMAVFQAANGGGQKTLGQHLEAYQSACADCLHGGPRASGLKDPARRNMAARAAECLRAEQEAAFAAKDCRVGQNTKLRGQSLPLRTFQSPMRRPR